MGWSYRKSFGSGPFRVNLSKSGLSYSFGAKGARVNVGPKGTFLNLSSHGLTYRKKISGSPNVPRKIYPAQPHYSLPANSTIQLSDTASGDFVSEMTKRENQVSYVTWFGIVPGVIALIAMLIQSVTNPLLWYVSIFAYGFWLLWLYQIDCKRYALQLHYDMDDQFKIVHREFLGHFSAFSQSARIWQNINTQHVNDAKRNGGAGTLIQRKAIQMIAEHQLPLRNFNTNVTIPYIRLQTMELYFLPERLLIKSATGYAAIFYQHIQITNVNTRFVESESLPRDAQVVDHTWLYLNKSGGPDRRFTGNRQLPVCLYSEYTITSTTGFQEILMTSKTGAMDALATFLTRIGRLQSQTI